MSSSAKTTGAQPNGNGSSTPKNREHNQGNQNREYTSAQKAAVDKVRRCKVTDFYAILDIEKTANDGDIKKAYRKLALIMHPDKNGAPGADEAFKMISRAFQVLSDPSKRAQYDRYGGDPDSRGGGGSAGNGGGGGAGSSNPFSNGFGSARAGYPFGGDDISPEDLFNMFFGGGLGRTAFQQAFFDSDTGFVSFGAGPGIHMQFGGVPGRRGARVNRNNNNNNQNDTTQEEEVSLLRTFANLLPLLIFFVIPILTSLFSELGTGYSSTSRTPGFRFSKIQPFTQERFTPKHRIPFWVNPKEVGDLSDKKKRDLDNLAEVQYVNGLISECHREKANRDQEVQDAIGWGFMPDTERIKKAKERVLPACKRVVELGEGRVLS